MAISQKNQKMLANMAPNLLYAFIPESEVTYEVFGKFVTNIQEKREAQRTFIQGVARAQLYTSSERFYDYVREQLEEVYGKNIQDIIYYLAENGSLPATKYEQESVSGLCTQIAGVNDAAFDIIKQNFGASMDLGSFSTKSGVVAGGLSSTNYDTFGNTFKNTYLPNSGLSLTSVKGANGFSLYSASDGVSTFNLSTGAQLSANQGNFWNNLNNALPAIQGLLSTVLNILKPTLNPYKMSPSQVGDGWVAPYNNKSNNMTTAIVLTGIVGGAVLLADKKK